MNSFYGGKQGRTYHIVQRFDCVNINSFEAEYIDQYNESKTIEQQINNIPTFPIQEQTSYLKGEVYKIQNSDSAIYYLIIEDFDLTGIDDATLKRQALLEHSSEIKAMVQEFQKGGAYTRVNYGQYVIIDTIKNRNHKSDLENGLLFRRGFDYNQTDIVEKPNIKDEQFYSNDEYHIFDKIKWQAAWSAWVENVGGGAIYIGQIVGPQGDTPQLVPITWEQLQDKKDYSYQEVSPVSETYGWTQEDGYDDTVKVATVTLKDNDGNITGANLAFDIPQPTIIVSAQSVSAYGLQAINPNDGLRTHEDIAGGVPDQNIPIRVIHQDDDINKPIVKYENLIHLHTATGKDGGHPFYYNYDIAIPHGIHGNDIVSVQQESGQDILEDSEYTEDSKGIDLETNDQYITFSLKNYDVREAGDIIDAHHGRFPYKVIQTISENIVNRIIYQGGSAKIGDLYQYNNNPGFFAVCVKAGTLDDISKLIPTGVLTEGTVIRTGTSENDTAWRVLKLSQTASAESFTIDYTYGPDSNPIDTHFIDYIYMDDYGYLYAVYADQTTHNIGFINSVTKVRYEIINNQGFEQGCFVFEFSNGTTQSFSVNLPLDIKRVGDNIVVLYSDQKKAAEEAAQHIPYYSIEYEGTQRLYKVLANTEGNYHIQGKYNLIDLVKYYNPENYPEYDSQNPPIYDQEGILYNGIEELQDPSYIPPMPEEYDGTQQEWEQEYKNNWRKSVQDRAGWVVAIQETIQGEDIFTIYAYDYNVNNYDIDSQTGQYLPPYVIEDVPYTWNDQYDYTHYSTLHNCPTYWYPIETISLANINPEYFYLISECDENNINLPDDGNSTKADKLNINGIWFETFKGHDNY